MTTYPITITNPDAETGTTTGWTMTDWGLSAINTVAPHGGTWCFSGEAGFNKTFAGMYQIINVDPAHYTLVDNELVQIFTKGWHKTQDPDDPGRIQVTLYSGAGGTGTNLGSAASANHTTNVWTQLTASLAVPAGTRSIKIDVTATNGDANLDYVNLWDDFTAYFDDTPAVSIRDQQLGVYALGQQPATNTLAEQLGGQVLGAAETSSGEFDVFTHLLGIYALVKGFPDRRDLRAWTFTQDEHDFYVIQLGDAYTLVYDKLTEQWAEWRSPGFNYWRAIDGVGWEGMNIACDNLSGKLWLIDPLGRLDYETTPITSIIVGGTSYRDRKSSPCYNAELSISQGRPPAQLPEGGVGISLRTSDDAMLNWVEHGTILGEEIGTETLIRWYSLGLMDSPGRVFEITDTGYARRIDGLNIELGDEVVG